MADVGQHQMMTRVIISLKNQIHSLLPVDWAQWAMHCRQLFGAKVGAPDREVVAIIGDGWFQMTIQELGTIAQSGLPVKIIILNNNFLGMVRQWQQLFHEKRYSFVELQNPDFITIAKGFGIDGHTCACEGKSE